MPLGIVPVTMQIDISELVDVFPDFSLIAVVAAIGAIPRERPAGLAELIGAREAEVRARFTDMELADIPGITAWRRAYRAFGIKRTSYRSSVERLLKNALAGRALVAINGFVDCYNLVSLAHVLPAGADDLDRVSGDLSFRFSRPGDSFLDMAGETAAEDPPKDGEVVYADDEKVLCRRWNWRQDVRSLVTPETRRAVVTLQANGWGGLDEAASDLVGLLDRYCGARTAITRVDRTKPVAELCFPHSA